MHITVRFRKCYPSLLSGEALWDYMSAYFFPERREASLPSYETKQVVKNTLLRSILNDILEFYNNRKFVILRCCLYPFKIMFYFLEF